MLEKNIKLLSVIKKAAVFVAVMVLFLSFFAIANTIGAVDVEENKFEESSENAHWFSGSIEEFGARIREFFLITDEEIISEEQENDENTALEELDEIADEEIIEEVGLDEQQVPQKEDVTEEQEESEEALPEAISLELEKKEETTEERDADVQTLSLKKSAAVMPLAVSEQETKQAVVTISCVEKETNKVLKIGEVTGTVGSTLTVFAEEIPGYDVALESIDIEVKSAGNSVVFTYIAEKKEEPVQEEAVVATPSEKTIQEVKKGIETIVTISYTNQDGKALKASKQIKSISGSVITIFAEEIEGYTAKYKEETITVKEAGAEIKFIYVRNDEEIIKSGAATIKAEEPAEQPKDNAPKTGDNTAVAIFAGIFVLAAGMFIFSKKRYDALAKD